MTPLVNIINILLMVTAV